MTAAFSPLPGDSIGHMDYRSWLKHRFLEFEGLLSPLTDVHPGRTCISISQLEGRTVLLLARY